MLKRHITSVSFVNCVFLSSFKFNYDDLINLVSYRNDATLAMLEAIPSKDLIYLDILDIVLDDFAQEKLMRCLLRFKRLETFKFSKAGGHGKYCRGEILWLRKVKHLELVNTMPIRSFVKYLEGLKHPLKLEY